MSQKKDISNMIDTSVKYNSDDIALLAEIEQWSFHSLRESDMNEFEKQKSLLQKSAKAHRTAKKLISLRVAQSDISKIKQMAEEQGIPYQTLLSAFIHKLANKKIELSLK